MRKTATLLALAAVCAAPLLADSALKQHPVQVNEKANQPPLGTHATNIANTVMYSSTVVGGPTWTRPLSDCSGLSGIGVGVPRHLQPFFVSANGAYDITSVQDADWDGFLLIYQNSFDPNNQLTNCIGGNDDGAGGIGTSDVLGLALTAGTQYFVVTTAFEPGEEGTFTNTISGPGTVTLGSLGGNADFGITLTTAGVPDSGDFDYDLTASNAGPDAGTGVAVTVTLPASVTFVSSTCGASAVAQVVTWNIGNFPVGSSACTMTVNNAAPGCDSATTTATIAGQQFDSNPTNNSATASNATESVADGSFEGGTPNASWAEASTNFGTPLCDSACGFGTGTGPHTGNFWSWFGGIAAPEVGSLTQSVTIPDGSVMTFFFEAPICANGTDFVRAQIDGNTVWEATGTHPQCNTVGYTQVTVDISAFDDGASHTLAFTSTISGSPSGSNFFVDDVSIELATCVAGGGGGGFPTTFDVAVPTLSEIGMIAMALLIALSAGLMLRRS